MQNEQQNFPFTAGFPPVDFPPTIAELFEPAEFEHLVFVELALCDAKAAQQARRLREKEKKAQ
jgi:hypothetical protein